MPRSAPKHKPMPHVAKVHVTPQQERYGQGRGGRPWRRLRDAILQRDGFLCRPCAAAGRVRLATQVDHIVGKARGGSDDETNLQSICDPCHRAKSQAEARG